jgi:hypothetical protein
MQLYSLQEEPISTQYPQLLFVVRTANSGASSCLRVHFERTRVRTRVLTQTHCVLLLLQAFQASNEAANPLVGCDGRTQVR